MMATQDKTIKYYLQFFIAIVLNSTNNKKRIIICLRKGILLLNLPLILFIQNILLLLLIIAFKIVYDEAENTLLLSCFIFIITFFLMHLIRYFNIPCHFTIAFI